MKKTIAILFALVMCAAAPSIAAEKGASIHIGTVNVKAILEKSKFGVQEQARFDGMRKQMEHTLAQKEKELSELAPKFTDEYLDSLTPEAEAELKEKFNTLSQDLTQKQNEFYQTLQQTQGQIVQKVFEMVADASKVLAKEKGFDVIVNDELCFFRADALDVSDDVIKKLDEMEVKTDGTKAHEQESTKAKG